jgi:hypothetical protein
MRKLNSASSLNVMAILWLIEAITRLQTQSLTCAWV